MNYRICIGCGRKFVKNEKKGVKWTYSKFCSPSCRKKYIAQSYIITGKYTRNYGKCAYCGKETYTTLKDAKHMFCDIKCKALWQKENLLNKNNSNFNKRHPGMGTGRIHSLESRRKNRDATIKQLENQHIFCDTDIERAIENQLLFNNILYVKQYRYKLGVADFWLPEGNLIVECDGVFWHSLEKNSKRDEIQTAWLEDNDYLVLRFSGKEIKENIKGCLELIQSML